ncbi:hypothetical protein A9Q78_09310 [Methylophaga sp. 41_12_T18]|nr:hypothetical protein A9Q78_09310 [Methylophaga sp. 41_12_T18]
MRTNVINHTKFKKYSLQLLFLIIATQLTGCISSNRIKPAPPIEEAIAIDFIDQELSGWSDLPPGIHRIPDSQVIISGHQSSGLVGVLFGPLGMLIQDGVDSSIGSSASDKSQHILNITLTNEAEKITQELLQTSNLRKEFTTLSTPSLPQLKVRTAVILTFVSDENVRPYVLLQASMTKPNETAPIWNTRYMSSTGAAKPLVGDGSWTENEGVELKQYLSDNLQSSIKLMLNDVSSPYPRDENELTMVQGYYPYMRKRIQTIGFKLTEDENSIIYVPRLGDAMVFSGVHVMDKSLTTFRVAQPDDSFFKALDDEPK